MRYNPDIHNRKLLRLKNYDYSKEGMYYITICTKNREEILSKIENVGVALQGDPNPKIKHDPNPKIKHDPNPKIKHDPSPKIKHDPNPKIKHDPNPKIKHDQNSKIIYNPNSKAIYNSNIKMIYNQNKENIENICNVNNTQIVIPKINLTEEGKVIQKNINSINRYYKNIVIDKYVIMPNHVHMIIIIGLQNKLAISGSPRTATPTMTIPKIINSFKSIVTKQIGYSIWQRNYYEHIIRTKEEYNQIRKYIKQNPLKWLKNKQEL